MAIYILIRKFYEDETSAVYLFGYNETSVGKLRLTKATGVVELIEPLVGDDGRIFARASYKIKQHWSAGELPDTTCWAS